MKKQGINKCTKAQIKRQALFTSMTNKTFDK